MTIAEFKAFTPAKAGEQAYCEDCSAAALCVSTAASLGAWADSGDRTANCE